MNDNTTIRPAEMTDASGIVHVMAELGYPSTSEEMAERLVRVQSAPSDLVLVADRQGDIVGLLSIHLIPMLHANGTTGRVTAFVVSDDHRGKGIGSGLMRAAQDWAWSNNCRKLEVTPGPERTRAHEFYERMGFAPANRRFVNEKPE